MADGINEDLATIIQRYGQVADAVNRREMRRFTKEIRRRWNPDPPEEWDPHGEGYTDEGALTLCIYQLAFIDYNPERQRPMWEAEEQSQILLRPSIDEMADEIPKPLADPAPAEKVEKKLNSLQQQLQDLFGQSTAAANAARISLPKDFVELMAITNGIKGAGVPSETAETSLVYRLDDHSAEAKMLHYSSRRSKLFGFTALAAWEMSSCTQHRQIYYVSCHENNGNIADASWRVLDVAHAESDMYDNLAEFLKYQTSYVEERPGGSMQEEIANSGHENLRVLEEGSLDDDDWVAIERVACP